MKKKEYAEYGRINYKKAGIVDFDSAVMLGKMLLNMDRGKIENPFECTLYLLKQGFDLFNLIPEGLAIDATTLPQK